MGPLPWRLAPRFTDLPLVFCDASKLTWGGLGVVLFATPSSEPICEARQVAPKDSHALELEAAVFGLEAAARVFPDRASALFCDNLDAVQRLVAAKQLGLACDPALATRFAGRDLAHLLAHAASINWVQGHGRCRGNALADETARAAARGESLTANGCHTISVKPNF